MQKYLILVFLIITMNLFSQTPTNIEGIGYKFTIDLPTDATYDFMETSFLDESGKVEYKSYLQILMSVNNRTVSVTVDKSDFDKERLKTEWLTDDTSKIVEETNHSLMIRTLENGTENYHLIFQKTIGNTSYLFIMYYQFLTLSEVKKVIKILDTARE